MKTTTIRAVTARLGNFIKVREERTNAIIVYFTNGIVYTSYDAVVAIYLFGEGYYYTKYHDYSRTTNLHLLMMISYSKQERIKALADGNAVFIEDYIRP